MTDTQEQIPAADPAGNGTAAPARAKRASLSTMLLPELQQLAGGMGISTAKLKKSDLVAAIRAAQSGGAAAPTTAAPAAPTAGSASADTRAPRATTDSGTGAAERDGASAATSTSERPATERPATERPATERPARRERTRRGASSAVTTVGSEQPTLPTQPAGDGEDRESRVRDTRDGREQDRRTREPREAQQRDEQPREGQNGSAAAREGQTRAPGSGQSRAQANAADGRTRDQNRDGQNRDGQNRDGQNRDQNRDGQNRDGQNRDQSRDAQNRDQNRDAQNRDGDPFDEDGEGGRRRGRRYRDRRGRNRERQPGEVGRSAGSDLEPTVHDDDVLIPVGGILDTVEEKNMWFVRVGGYYATNDDVYVANSFVRKYNLRRGDAVTGAVRQQREGERREKYNPLVRLDSVNGAPAEANPHRVEFTKLTPLYPQERLRLETEPHILTTRVIDLVMPIGKGQRALIVSPPKAGKTSVLQAIANAIAINNPECHLMVVLVDERPEEVTDMQRSVKGEVIASTFDRKPSDHTLVAELSIERAKRLVELGHDVVVLLDSITRLGRAYNLAAPASGRILSGGVDSTALYPPKRFLGAARNIENGGSLTILATALVETGSAGDTVIFEEFKGTGNAELKLDRKIADKRIFPAVDVDQSSTRKEELLLSPDELAVTIKLRRVLHSLDSQEAINLLLDRLRKTRTNIEFLTQIARTTPGQD